IVAQQTGEQIADFDGLAKRSPFLAFEMLIGMVSLAGVPFTAGFLGKFFIFYAAILQRQIALVVIGVITVGCGFYYYLKVVGAIWAASVCGSGSCGLLAEAGCPSVYYRRYTSRPRFPRSSSRRDRAAPRDRDWGRYVQKLLHSTGRCSCRVRKRCDA